MTKKDKSEKLHDEQEALHAIKRYCKNLVFRRYNKKLKKFGGFIVRKTVRDYILKAVDNMILEVNEDIHDLEIEGKIKKRKKK